MIVGKSFWRVCALVAFASSTLSPALADPPAADSTPRSAAVPAGPNGAVLVADRINPALRPQTALPNEHPLMPCIRWAKAGLAEIEKINDYSATLAKRERIGNKLGDYEYLFAKIRHRPFSVYLYFLSPNNIRGQEVIFIDGKNNGNMWAHTIGVRDALVGTVSLKPDGLIAMQGQRYPLTEIGLLNLTRRLVDIAEQDTHYGECEVKFFQGAKINDRVCTCLQVVHPVPRRNFLFHVARIYVDDEISVPVRYEAYDWPKEAGGAPELTEEYTYLNLKVNNGFTDEDFDIHNPKYRFR